MSDDLVGDLDSAMAAEPAAPVNLDARYPELRAIVERYLENRRNGNTWSTNKLSEFLRARGVDVNSNSLRHYIRSRFPNEQLG